MEMSKPWLSWSISHMFPDHPTMNPKTMHILISLPVNILKRQKPWFSRGWNHIFGTIERGLFTGDGIILSGHSLNGTGSHYITSLGRDPGRLSHHFSHGFPKALSPWSPCPPVHHGIPWWMPRWSSECPQLPDEGFRHICFFHGNLWKLHRNTCFWDMSRCFWRVI